MPEYESIEKMPQYTQLNVDHQIALSNAGDDETAQLRAKLEWSDKRQALENERQRVNSEFRALNEGREKIKAEYPDVPENLYSGRSTVEEMEVVAREFDEAVKARGSGAPAPSAASTGQPPTGLGTPPASNDGEEWADRLGELRSKINSGHASRQEVEEFQDIKMGHQMIPAAVRAKREAGQHV